MSNSRWILKLNYNLMILSVLQLVHKTNIDWRIAYLIGHELDCHYASIWKDCKSDVTFFLNIADGFIPITYTVTVTWRGFLTGCVRGDQLDSSHSAWHLFTWGDLMLLMFRKKNTSVQVTSEVLLSSVILYWCSH